MSNEPNRSAVRRMDHTGVVVEDLAAAIAFFAALGLELEGEATVGGEWADRLIGLSGVEAEIAMMRVPGGEGRIELSQFRSPTTTRPAPKEPVDTPGIPRLTFAVDAIDAALARLRPHGAELVGEVAQYEDLLRYVYVRGPANVILGLVEELR